MQGAGSGPKKESFKQHFNQFAQNTSGKRTVTGHSIKKPNPAHLPEAKVTKRAGEKLTSDLDEFCAKAITDSKANGGEDYFKSSDFATQIKPIIKRVLLASQETQQFDVAWDALYATLKEGLSDDKGITKIVETTKRNKTIRKEVDVIREWINKAQQELDALYVDQLNIEYYEEEYDKYFKFNNFSDIIKKNDSYKTRDDKDQKVLHEHENTLQEQLAKELDLGDRVEDVVSLLPNADTDNLNKSGSRSIDEPIGFDEAYEQFTEQSKGFLELTKQHQLLNSKLSAPHVVFPKGDDLKTLETNLKTLFDNIREATDLQSHITRNLQTLVDDGSAEEKAEPQNKESLKGQLQDQFKAFSIKFNQTASLLQETIQLADKLGNQSQIHLDYENLIVNIKKQIHSSIAFKQVLLSSIADETDQQKVSEQIDQGLMPTIEALQTLMQTHPTNLEHKEQIIEQAEQLLETLEKQNTTCYKALGIEEYSFNLLRRYLKLSRYIENSIPTAKADSKQQTQLKDLLEKVRGHQQSLFDSETKKFNKIEEPDDKLEVTLFELEKQFKSLDQKIQLDLDIKKGRRIKESKDLITKLDILSQAFNVSTELCEKNSIFAAQLREAIELVKKAESLQAIVEIDKLAEGKITPIRDHIDAFTTKYPDLGPLMTDFVDLSDSRIPETQDQLGRVFNAFQFILTTDDDGTVIVNPETKQKIEAVLTAVKNQENITRLIGLQDTVNDLQEELMPLTHLLDENLPSTVKDDIIGEYKDSVWETLNSLEAAIEEAVQQVDESGTDLEKLLPTLLENLADYEETLNQFQDKYGLTAPILNALLRNQDLKQELNSRPIPNKTQLIQKLQSLDQRLFNVDEKRFDDTRLDDYEHDIDVTQQDSLALFEGFAKAVQYARELPQYVTSLEETLGEYNVPQDGELSSESVALNEHLKALKSMSEQAEALHEKITSPQTEEDEAQLEDNMKTYQSLIQSWLELNGKSVVLIRNLTTAIAKTKEKNSKQLDSLRSQAELLQKIFKDDETTAAQLADNLEKLKGIANEYYQATSLEELQRKDEGQVIQVQTQDIQEVFDSLWQKVPGTKLLAEAINNAKPLCESRKDEGTLDQISNQFEGIVTLDEDGEGLTVSQSGLETIERQLRKFLSDKARYIKQDLRISMAQLKALDTTMTVLKLNETKPQTAATTLLNAIKAAVEKALEVKTIDPKALLKLQNLNTKCEKLIEDTRNDFDIPVVIVEFFQKIDKLTSLIKQSDPKAKDTLRVAALLKTCNQEDMLKSLFTKDEDGKIQLLIAEDEHSHTIYSLVEELNQAERTLQNNIRLTQRMQAHFRGNVARNKHSELTETVAPNKQQKDAIIQKVNFQSGWLIEDPKTLERLNTLTGTTTEKYKEIAKAAQPVFETKLQDLEKLGVRINYGHIDTKSMKENDEILCVCQSGKNRSQLTRAILQTLLNKEVSHGAYGYNTMDPALPIEQIVSVPNKPKVNQKTFVPDVLNSNHTISKEALKQLLDAEKRVFTAKTDEEEKALRQKRGEIVQNMTDPDSFNISVRQLKEYYDEAFRTLLNGKPSHIVVLAGQEAIVQRLLNLAKEDTDLDLSKVSIHILPLPDRLVENINLDKFEENLRQKFGSIPTFKGLAAKATYATEIPESIDLLDLLFESHKTFSFGIEVLRNASLTKQQWYKAVGRFIDRHARVIENCLSNTEPALRPDHKLEVLESLLNIGVQPPLPKDIRKDLKESVRTRVTPPFERGTISLQDRVVWVHKCWSNVEGGAPENSLYKKQVVGKKLIISNLLDAEREIMNALIRNKTNLMNAFEESFQVSGEEAEKIAQIYNTSGPISDKQISEYNQLSEAGAADDEGIVKAKGRLKTLLDEYKSKSKKRIYFRKQVVRYLLNPKDNNDKLLTLFKLNDEYNDDLNQLHRRIRTITNTLTLNQHLSAVEEETKEAQVLTLEEAQEALKVYLASKEQIPRDLTRIPGTLQSDHRIISIANDILFQHGLADKELNIAEDEVYKHDLDIPKGIKQANGSYAPIVTLPSCIHSENNQDRVSLWENEDSRITTLCDGVSECGYTFLGKITGREAAIHMTTQLKNWYSSGEFQGLLAELKKDINQGSVQAFTEAVHAKVTELAKEIDPPESATTLELCLELIADNGEKHVLAISYGDSQTMIVKKDAEIVQMNAAMFQELRNNTIISSHNLDETPHKCDEDFMPLYSNPNGIVGGTELTAPTASFMKVNPGDMIITCSDGLGDAISIKNLNRFGDDLDPDLLQHLLNIRHAKGLDDYQTAELLMAYSVQYSPKKDDVAVSVRTVG